ncbi:hypothetical protein VBD025_14660 [Virgibacillus flavescens]
MGLLLTILSVISAAGFLFYLGKSGNEFGTEETNDDDENPY